MCAGHGGLRTARPLLRRWRESDLEPWAAMNADRGHGYATEAALACLAFGFEVLGLPEVVASTTVDNLRSRAVTRRIGMNRDPADDFEDPGVPEGPLRRCVLYRAPAETLTAWTTRCR
ncbi:GNAT family N-acetyltransferase [Streptomyces virginiae]|uniref:GNAT family N-acetyltransferase n=1 Tax=Streptomyces virginiae TaxID=1961 RepID=UPI0035DE837C